MRALDTSDERSDITDHLQQSYRRAMDTWYRRNKEPTGHTNPDYEEAPLIAMQPRGRSAMGMAGPSNVSNHSLKNYASLDTRDDVRT